ncbi:protein-disulfide reductase DsbD family protein [Marinimicrobium sp. ARAG 43.8]|uniref:protein-disulfide reductase DsbD family protein n=1 Tax=Marinimicrobium sp. ARAG 43.8 TaxID=3418719 RepID=UPI003CEBCB0E
MPVTDARPARGLIALRRHLLVLFTVLFTVLGVWSQSALSQNLLGDQQSSTGGSNLLGGNNDFLPVTEAFQLETRFYEGELVLNWEIAPEYYLYQERFGFTAQPEPFTLTPRFSDNTTEKYDEYFEKHMAVYYGSATLRLTIPEDAPPFVLAVQSQGCADAGLCYPPHTDYLQINPAESRVTITDGFPADAAPTSSGGANNAPSTPSASLPYILLIALLGGMILNLMPCVFPVLSIKVMGLAQAHGKRLPLHGWAYTAGVILCFALFAGILLAARHGGEAIGWGFQLQSPGLIAALFYLFFILGLSLSGLLVMGSRWMGVGERLTHSGGLSGSFFTGVLAAVVASPCTAPFMGAALGYALTQPALTSLSVFIALGFGMALPLLVLCYLPALVRHLPSPGPWMESLRQFLAFPLYLTAVWLLWVLSRQAGADAVAAVGTGAVAIAFAGWLLTRQPRRPTTQWLRVALVGFAWAAVIILPWRALQPDANEERWQAYSATKLAALRAEGKPVFINLTADWCLTCLANERVTLDTQEVQDAFDRHNVATLKGDWTNRDAAVTQVLSDYGRSGVPLYLWFPADHEGPGHILPQILRKGDLLERLAEGARPQ